MACQADMVENLVTLGGVSNIFDESGFCMKE